jgi:hypothetical protein
MGGTGLEVNMNTMRRLLWIVFLVTAGAVAFATLATASETPCVTAAVASPVRLPDGSLHEGGALTVCDVRTLSPVASFHRISIDGRAVGLFVSRRGASEAAADSAPTILFLDDDSGTLALIGYVVSSSRASTAFRLASPPAERARRGTAAGAVVALAAAAR